MNISVLIIEDERADIAIVCESLADTSAGTAQIARASSLAEGMQRMADGDIDIVLLDLSLPDSEGQATLARLRQADPDIPVLVIGGTAASTDTSEDLLGAPQFILKDHVECHRLGGIVRSVIREARRPRCVDPDA